MKFKMSFACDVCGREITPNNFRIEWGTTSSPSRREKKPFDFIQVCHDDCSYGIHNTTDKESFILGDIIFSQFPYDPELTFDRLNELSQDNPEIKEKIEKIKNKIFD